MSRARDALGTVGRTTSTLYGDGWEARDGAGALVGFVADNAPTDAPGATVGGLLVGTADRYALALSLVGLRRPYRACPPLAILRESWDRDDPAGSACRALDVLDDALELAADPDAIVDDDDDTRALAAQVVAGRMTVDELHTAWRIVARYYALVAPDGDV
jgi:hypothetical protein